MVCWEQYCQGRQKGQVYAVETDIEKNNCPQILLPSNTINVNARTNIN